MVAVKQKLSSFTIYIKITSHNSYNYSSGGTCGAAERHLQGEVDMYCYNIE